MLPQFVLLNFRWASSGTHQQSLKPPARTVELSRVSRNLLDLQSGRVAEGSTKHIQFLPDGHPAYPLSLLLLLGDDARDLQFPLPECFLHHE